MFDVANINKSFNSASRKHDKSFYETEFGTHKGLKFDGQGHSWLYLQGDLLLSYNYMAFVINQAMLEKSSYQNDDYLFDVDQYNYLINRKTALSNKELISNP
jgi:hypothetical protein